MVGNHFNKTKAVYLDYAATTPTHSLVVSAFKRAVIKYPGNPEFGSCFRARSRG